MMSIDELELSPMMQPILSYPSPTAIGGPLSQLPLVRPYRDRRGRASGTMDSRDKSPVMTVEEKGGGPISGPHILALSPKFNENHAPDRNLVEEADRQGER